MIFYSRQYFCLQSLHLSQERCPGSTYWNASFKPVKNLQHSSAKPKHSHQIHLTSTAPDLCPRILLTTFKKPQIKQLIKRSYKQLLFIRAGIAQFGHIFCIHRTKSLRLYLRNNFDMLLWHDSGSSLISNPECEQITGRWDMVRSS